MTAPLLKAKDVAERLSVNLDQAFALMSDGTMPAIRFGLYVRVRTEDLEEFIQTNLTKHQKIDPLKAILAVTAARMESQMANPILKEINHVH